MNNIGKLMPYKNICIDFTKKINIGEKIFWAGTYFDYDKDEIIIIPENTSFVPEPESKYLVQRPKGFEKPLVLFDEIPVYKRKVLEIKLIRAENEIRFYKSNCFVPRCAINGDKYSVFFRPSRNANNQFALVWIKDDMVRKGVAEYFEKALGVILKKNSTEVLEIETGMGQTEFEKQIIESIVCQNKG